MKANPSSNTVAHALVSGLQAEGVRHVFGLPGSHILAVYDALADTGIRHVSAAHESSSAFMAGMVGYLTGRPGVTLLTAGPGATNALTGVAQAYASSLPLVQITGDVPLRARREAFHGTDRPDFLHRVFAPVTKWSVRLEDPAETRAVLARAFAVARSGRPGPVHISVPMDLAGVEATGAACAPQPEAAVAPSQAFLASVVERLRSAERPMICACRGVLVEDAGSDLEALAEALGAPVLSTSYGLGAIRHDHPLAAGTFSEFSKNSFAFELIARSDFLLVVGLRSGTLMTETLAKVAPARSAFVAFDERGSAAEGWPGDHEACSIKLALRALRDGVHGERRPDVDLRGAIAANERSFQRGLATTLRSAERAEPLHFGVVMRTLAGRLARDAITVSGVGHHHVWARNLIPAWDRTSFVAESAWGTMGGELGAGIAAKIVHPERQVVVVTGDASLLMVAGELLTAVKERAHVLVVVLNDGRHGIIGAMQRQLFGRACGDSIGPVSFAKMAESVGAVGLRLTSPLDIETAVERALSATRQAPVVLDVVCGADFPWPNRDKLVELGRASKEAEAS